MIDPVGISVGVAVDDLHPLDGDAEAVADQHGPGRVVALAVGVGAGLDQDGAVGAQLHLAVFRRRRR